MTTATTPGTIPDLVCIPRAEYERLRLVEHQYESLTLLMRDIGAYWTARAGAAGEGQAPAEVALPCPMR